MALKGRANRLKVIRRIIENSIIESQEELLGYLEKEGVQVTQATLSRDLKLLKVGKVSDGSSGYHYTLPGDKQTAELEKNYLQDLKRGFLSLEFSRNIGVLKTLPGHADSVALAFDHLDIPEVIGTIAGDDAILLVLREDVLPEQFRAMLRDRIPNLDMEG